GVVTITNTPGADPLESIFKGIDEILEQGEGASAHSLITTGEFESEESHYLKFAEIYYGAEYQEPNPPIELTSETGTLFLKGLPVGWPVVVNSLAVPSDGYAQILALDPNAAAVSKDLKAFDTAFTTILANLDAVWNGPVAASWKTLGAAVHGMVD